MEKFKVSFEANNQQLKSIGTKHASDTYADIEATFVLGEKWTDMDSVSAVWWNDFTRIATVLDSQGKCIVPHEVLARKGCVRVNLVGSIVEGDELITRLTSYSAEAVQVNEKIKLTGNETSEITPSQYEQFVAKVANDANRAEQSATDAKTYADEAEASAQNASESASASAVSASDSARSATASAESAQNASEIAVEVEVMKNEVELAKDKVLGMRATAETLEAGSDATASYSDGLLTLGIPKGDQGIQGIQGETGATPNLTIGTVETLEPTEDATATITGTAEEPVLNLGIPKGDTGEVSLEDLEALLPTDTASGDIVTIPDGQSVIPAESLKVALEPIQDLHGYDKPWAGGAGKNKLQVTATSKTLGGITFTVNSDGSIKADGTASGWGGVYKNAGRASLKANTQYTLYAEGGSGGTYYLDLLNGTTKLATTEYKSGVSFTPTEDVEATLDVCVYYNKTVNAQTMYPMICLASETDTSFAPYSNICPISGHTECVTEVCGVNVWDEEWEEGTINTNGDNSSSTTRWRTKNYINIKPNTQYYFKGTKTGSGTASIRPRFYDANKVYIGNTSQSGTDIVANTVFTTPTNAYYMRFTPDKSGTYGILTDEVSINYPSTDTEYHPYDGETYHTELEGNYTVVGTDNEPYLLKAVDGIKGDRLRESIVGGTVNWNQLAKARASGSSNGITATQDANGVITLNGTATNTYSNFCENYTKAFNRKYLIAWNVISNPNNLPIRPTSNSGVREKLYHGNAGIFVGNDVSNNTANFGADQMTSGADYTGVKIKVNYFDLTAMLGTQIADYIYSLETATAGAGVAWFKSLFPNDYYPYNSGELMSVNTSAHVTKDANGNVVGNYPLDSSLTLRGIPKLDASNNLYYDGDVYKSDGSVQRKYGVVDLGTLWWTAYASSAFTLLFAKIDGLVSRNGANGICTKYPLLIGNYNWQSLNDKQAVLYVGAGETRIGVRDSAYTDAASFKAAMNGVQLVYELATPTEETAEPFEEIQKFINGGTLQYLTNGIVPVGHETEYLSRETFGCTLDVVSGELNVTHAMVTYDGSSDEAWTWEGANHRGYIERSDVKRRNGYVGHLICDKLQTAPAYADTTPMSVGAYPLNTLYKSQNWIYIGNENIETKGELLAWLADLQPTVCYELATPQTIQLTPQEVRLLLGTNNIWSDGKVTLTYNADIQRYIEKKLGTRSTLTMSRPMTEETE